MKDKAKGIKEQDEIDYTNHIIKYDDEYVHNSNARA